MKKYISLENSDMVHGIYKILNNVSCYCILYKISKKQVRTLKNKSISPKCYRERASAVSVFKNMKVNKKNYI